MTRGAWAVLLAIAVVPASGCGTICNFAGAPFCKEGDLPLPAVYGGVQLDAAFINTNTQAFTMNGFQAEGTGAAILVGCLLAEFPLSFIGDTLTLPITVWIDRRRTAAATGSRDPTPPDPGIVRDAPSTAMQAFAPDPAK
jgi:hypothetical protein